MKQSRSPAPKRSGGRSLPNRGRRWIWWLAPALLCGLAVIVISQTRKRAALSPTDLSRLSVAFPLPSMAPSSYENTRAGMEYVGTQRCVECHADQHASYLLTAHSRSMCPIDPAHEPSDGVFDHPASGRRYRSYRRGGDLRHQESLVSSDGRERVLCDQPLKYLIGSGRFSRSYLLEDQGFLIESPLTWYASLNDWAMSPGYDVRDHQAFHRTITYSCLYCHTGSLEPVDGNEEQVRIGEIAIGCERCHGPGSLHVARHTSGHSQPAPDGDPTIVNPNRLPRELAEAVCHQCHLTSEVQVPVRGRSVADFRPGLRWQDFAIDYQFDDPGKEMTVVGHVAQMRQSRCYQQSDSLTCITCHAAHEPVTAAERVGHYRAGCQQCHPEPACGVALAERSTKNNNDCVACHMPQSPTDIPHIAFTHHRIGIHQSAAASQQSVAAKRHLKPVLDDSWLPEIDRRRALGLAYLQYFRDHEQDQAARPFLEEAQALVESTMAAGMIDAPLAQARAEFAAAAGGSAEAVRWASVAMTSEHLNSKERRSAIRLLAGIALQANRPAEAQHHLEQLTTLCRDPRDWFLLGVSRQRQGNLAGAIAALERVRQIDPGPPETFEMLAELYRAQGSDKQADEYRQQAELRRISPK